MYSCSVLLLLLLCANHCVIHGQESCPARLPDDTCGLRAKGLRFLLYSVRPGEGFNLCRDVYMRMIQVAVSLREKGLDVTLVLPQWGPLPHWRNDAANVNLSWSNFFDVVSLNLLTPVMEMADFRAGISRRPDLQLHLSHFPDSFAEDSKWSERYEVRDCHENVPLQKDKGQEEDDDSGSNCRCSSSQSSNTKCLFLDGTTLTLANLIHKDFREHESILISNADVVLHENYGSPFFWQIRRSMRFSEILIQKGNSFRTKFLDSDDERDGTQLPNDWRLTLRTAGQAIGGNYVALHWRRADFAIYRKDVPSIQCTAEQVTGIIQATAGGIRRLFLASDAAEQEIDQLLEHLQKSGIEVNIFEDKRTDPMPQGQKAIIDQWICAHARLFIGKALLHNPHIFLHVKLEK